YEVRAGTWLRPLTGHRRRRHADECDAERQAHHGAQNNTRPAMLRCACSPGGPAMAATWPPRVTVSSVLIVLAILAVATNAASQTPQVTFTKDVAPILQRSCQNCHRTGSMAPMALLTY